MMGGMMLGGGDQAGGNGTPQVAKRNYLPGYLSGGIGASGGMGSSVSLSCLCSFVASC